MMNMNISFFNSVSAQAETKTIGEVLDLIKDEAIEPVITKIRMAAVDGEQDKLGDLKKSLPAFTPSGVFNGGHSKKELVEYHALMVLDFDHVGDVMQFKKQVADIPFTYTAFISPSGQGLKVLVKTRSTAENHEDVFNNLAAYYEAATRVRVDKSGKDFSRLCFLTSDTELYLNEAAEVFDASDYEDSNVSELEYVVTFTNKLEQYYPGNRNNFTYQLACNMNRTGIEENVAKDFILKKYSDLPESEVNSTVESAYSNKDEYGIWEPEYVQTASFASSASSANDNTGGNTPLVPEEVYAKLPQLLIIASDAFTVPREKDMFLTAALTVLSGAFDNVYGIYDRRKTKANLFSFVIAPPSSGKGVLRYAMKMGDHIEQVIVEKFQKAKDEGGDIQQLAISYFIPADSSSAAIKRHLKQNNGSGVISETEADTLSATLAQDWGGYSQLIRAAFEHEPISNSRIGKEKGEIYIQKIDFPKLSICIAGTPDQVPTLLQSTQNGLFSRFMFYTFRNNAIPTFKNVFAEDSVESYDEYFDSLSVKVHDYYKKYHKKGIVRFRNTQSQQADFLKYFERMKQKIYYEYGDETESIVNRLGKIAFRIAMLFTILRNADGGEIPDEIICNDDDFNSSMLLANVYLEHSLKVYQTLPGSGKTNPNAEVFYKFLPSQFTHSEAVKIGTKVCGISERTVPNYLNYLRKSGVIKQPQKHGEYFKTDLQ